ncbi:MAG: GGDEF domain-containing protein [Pseudomonadota bacterium]|nr:GGDEF domain-containing protein [Pseudomonadota bacterium]
MSSLPIGIVMAIGINVLVSVYFFAVYRAQQRNPSYLYWSVSCALFAAGISASVIAHAAEGLQAVNTLACLLLYTASFGLYCGLNKFELSPGSIRFYRRVRSLFIAGSALIAVAGFYAAMVNVVASVAMALMFVMTEGLFYQRKSPYKKVYLVLRGLLLLHAFVLFLQGIVILVQTLAAQDSVTHNLFNIVLLSHLVLTVATALVLPLLHVMNQRHQWQTLANLDELTGLPSRRAFVQKAAKSLSADDQACHSLLMVDIDHFKQVNDQFGHTFGDEVLSRVGKMLAEGLRQTDIIGRLGGEEFAILLPGISTERAQGVADRLRRKVSELKFKQGEQQLNITVSIGIAVSHEVLYNWEHLYSKADQALYTAKREGRNLVYVFN